LTDIVKTYCSAYVNTKVYISHYIPVSVSKNHAFLICRMIALCYYGIMSLDPQSLYVDFYYRQALLCTDTCLFPCFWIL